MIAARRRLKPRPAGFNPLPWKSECIGNQITTFDDYVRIDVMTSTPGLAFTDAWGRKIVARFEGEAVYPASREHLLASKRASGRQQDLEDVRILELSDTQESSQ